MRVLAISGSLRKASHNTALLRAAAALAPADVEMELNEGLALLPPFNEDTESEPPTQVVALRRQIERADAVLFATPEYNGTMPGQLKQVVDWASRPRGEAALLGKPVAVIGASVTDYGAIWAQDHLRKALGLAGARVVDTEMPVATAHTKFDADGKLADGETAERLVEVLGLLAEQHRSLVRQAA